MNNQNIMISGLLDGISVLEKDNTCYEPSYPSDKIYNDQEPIEFGIVIDDKLD